MENTLTRDTRKNAHTHTHFVLHISFFSIRQDFSIDDTQTPCRAEEIQKRAPPKKKGRVTHVRQIEDTQPNAEPRNVNTHGVTDGKLRVFLRMAKL